MKNEITVEQFLQLGRELEGCHWVANQAIDEEERKRANERMLEIEQQIQAAPYEYDDDGNLCVRK